MLGGPTFRSGGDLLGGPDGGAGRGCFILALSEAAELYYQRHHAAPGQAVGKARRRSRRDELADKPQMPTTSGIIRALYQPYRRTAT
jgi:hypothetical protein